MDEAAQDVITWTSVEPLSATDLEIDISEFNSITSAWFDAREGLERESKEALDEFNEQLRRSWSIETGILENLYFVDRGTTKTLIDKGFHSDLVDRAATDTDPARLVSLLKDHLAASDMLYALIQEDRPLTAHFIREIHSVLTQHQASVQATDSLGRTVDVVPLTGQWKSQPNWRDLPDGRRLDYCPPEQVQGQVDDLLTYLQMQEEEQVNVGILAAWFHHGFTYIHPFQDGNGRVARALLNYLFVKSGLFPVVIDRGQKSEYVDALEAADGGDLALFVQLLSAKQISAIKQALSLTDQVGDPQPTPLVKEVARGIVERVSRRRAQEQAQLRDVDKVIDSLADFAVELLRNELEDFRAELSSGEVEPRVNVDFGGNFDGRERYYRWQVIESVQQAHQWANFNENSRWVRALVQGLTSTLRVVFSFHHIGRSVSGVAEVTSIADLQDVEGNVDSVRDHERQTVDSMLQPFSLTWRDDPEDLKERFATWTRECLVTALRRWADTI